MKYTEFCKLVENTLGWEADASKPDWLRYNIEAAKLRKRVESQRFTEADMMLVLRWAQRERKVLSPSNLTYHVDQARKAAGRRNDSVPLQIDQAISVAVQHEYEHHPDDMTWVRRLTRAVGPARHDVINEWKEARGVE